MAGPSITTLLELHLMAIPPSSTQPSAGSERALCVCSQVACCCTRNCKPMSACAVRLSNFIWRALPEADTDTDFAALRSEP